MSKDHGHTAHKKKINLIVLHEIMKDEVMGSALIKEAGLNGVSWEFHACVPDDPITAFTYLICGANPGNVGFINPSTNAADLQNCEDFDKTIFCNAHENKVPTEYVINSCPELKEGLSVVVLNNLSILDNVIQRIDPESSDLFIVAPVVAEIASYTANINSFLRDMDIIALGDDGNIDWNETIAIEVKPGHVRINLEGRERHGTVSAGTEYEEVREVLIEGISQKLRDERGQNVVEQIYKREEIFSGSKIYDMPDLIVKLKPEYGFAQASGLNLIELPPLVHRQSKSYSAGIGVAVGSNFLKGEKCEKQFVSSIAPILVYRMGLTIPDWMEGKVKKELFNKSYFDDSPPQYQISEFGSSLSSHDEKEIADRLKDLGYL